MSLVIVSLTINYFLPLINQFPDLILKSNCISNRTINQNVTINDCLISNFFTSDNGGAISINNEQLSLFINDTTFYECISINGFGGAIYFDLGLTIQFFRICALYCEAQKSQFVELIVYEGNQLIELISKCSNKTNLETTLQLAYGNQKISNVNISNNNNFYISGIQYSIPKSMISN